MDEGMQKGGVCEKEVNYSPTLSPSDELQNEKAIITNENNLARFSATNDVQAKASGQIYVKAEPRVSRSQGSYATATRLRACGYGTPITIRKLDDDAAAWCWQHCTCLHILCAICQSDIYASLQP